MFPPIAPSFSPKGVLREKLKAERRHAAENRPDAGRHAARLFLDAIPLREGAVVALYHPLPDELDTTPLAEALLERGFVIALPAIAGRRAPLVFRRFKEGDRLVEGRHKTLEPAEDAEAITPHIVVAPLLGFTRGGARLGYGGGYYDRTLAALREKGDVLAIGYAYGAQEVETLPIDRLDQPLDWIVTERAAIRAQGTQR